MKVTGGVQLLIKLGLASGFKPLVSVLYSNFLLIIYFIYTSVYIHVNPTLLVHPSPLSFANHKFIFCLQVNFYLVYKFTCIILLV